LEGLAGVLVGEHQFAEAESLLREGVSLRQEVQGRKHPDGLVRITGWPGREVRVG